MSVDEPRLPENTHRAQHMDGRDPAEAHRVSSPLELLFDLTFAIGFGVAGIQLAHRIAEGHLEVGLVGFAYAIFAICWAWISYSWFASAYDTDDWIFRLATMVQMIGVIVLALGIPRMFASLDQGRAFDARVMVAGYVIMRLAAAFLFLRAASHDPPRRRSLLGWAAVVGGAQLGWTMLALTQPLVPLTVFLSLGLGVVEVYGPLGVFRRFGEIPWHSHHIVERYALLTIIALGEGVAGTVASVSAVVETHGWSAAAIMICVAGTGLTFGLWWIYFMIPSAEIMHHRRDRSFGWSNLHLMLFASIVAVGAGLHVASLSIQHKAHITASLVVGTTAVPVAVNVLTVYAIYYWLLPKFEWLHLAQLAGTALVIAASIALAAAGSSLSVCLAVLTLAPVVTVLGFELAGYRQTLAARSHVLHDGAATARD
jgi:low temperature requirement protein LtrA